MLLKKLTESIQTMNSSELNNCKLIRQANRRRIKKQLWMLKISGIVALHHSKLQGRQLSSVKESNTVICHTSDTSPNFGQIARFCVILS